MDEKALEDPGYLYVRPRLYIKTSEDAEYMHLETAEGFKFTQRKKDNDILASGFDTFHFNRTNVVGLLELVHVIQHNGLRSAKVHFLRVDGTPRIMYCQILGIKACFTTPAVCQVYDYEKLEFRAFHVMNVRYLIVAGTKYVSNWTTSC
jgi:hypothetical protein